MDDKVTMKKPQLKVIVERHCFDWSQQKQKMGPAGSQRTDLSVFSPSYAINKI